MANTASTLNAGASASGSGRRKALQGLLVLTPHNDRKSESASHSESQSGGKGSLDRRSYNDRKGNTDGGGDGDSLIDSEKLPPLIVGRSSAQNERISFQIGNENKELYTTIAYFYKP